MALLTGIDVTFKSSARLLISTLEKIFLRSPNTSEPSLTSRLKTISRDSWSKLTVCKRQPRSSATYLKLTPKAENIHSFKRGAPKLIKQKVTAFEHPVEEMNLAVA